MTWAAFCMIVAAGILGGVGPGSGSNRAEKTSFDEQHSFAVIESIKDVEYYAFAVDVHHRHPDPEREPDRMVAVAHMSPAALRTHVYRDGELYWAFGVKDGRVQEYRPTLEMPNGEIVEVAVLSFDASNPDLIQLSPSVLVEYWESCLVGGTTVSWNSTGDRQVDLVLSRIRGATRSGQSTLETTGKPVQSYTHTVAMVPDMEGYEPSGLVNEYALDPETGLLMRYTSIQLMGEREPHIRTRHYSHHVLGNEPEHMRWTLKASDFVQENMKTDPLFAIDRALLSEETKEIGVPHDMVSIARAAIDDAVKEAARAEVEASQTPEQAAALAEHEPVSDQ